MDFNRRNFLKGVSLAAFAGAAGGSGAVRAEGTTLVLPEMAKGGVARAEGTTLALP